MNRSAEPIEMDRSEPEPVWSGQRIIYVRTGRTCGRFRSAGWLVWSETLFRSGLGLVEFGFTFAVSTCFAKMVHIFHVGGVITRWNIKIF